MSNLPFSDKFEQCGTCINKKFDPFQCQDCVKASNYEIADSGFQDEESISYDDFLIMLRK